MPPGSRWKGFASAAAVGGVLVLIGVLATPWHTSTVLGLGGRTLVGTDAPFLGGWVIALAGLGGLSAGAALALRRGPGPRGTALLVSSGAYLVAFVLAGVDLFREDPAIPEVALPAARASKSFGILATALTAIVAAGCAGSAYQRLAARAPGRAGDD